MKKTFSVIIFSILVTAVTIINLKGYSNNLESHIEKNFSRVSVSAVKIKMTKPSYTCYDHYQEAWLQQQSCFDYWLYKFRQITNLGSTTEFHIMKENIEMSKLDK